MPVLVPRQEITGADRQWAERYEAGDVVRYSRGSKALGVEAGDYARVEHVDAKSNQVTVKTDDERTVSYDPRRLQGVTLYRETERAFAAGDRAQMTAPDRERGLPNRELGTVERVDRKGHIEVRWTPGGHRHSNRANGAIWTTGTRSRATAATGRPRGAFWCTSTRTVRGRSWSTNGWRTSRCHVGSTMPGSTPTTNQARTCSRPRCLSSVGAGTNKRARVAAQRPTGDVSERIDRSHDGRRFGMRPRCSAVSRVPFGGSAALDTASAPCVTSALTDGQFVRAPASLPWFGPAPTVLRHVERRRRETRVTAVARRIDAADRAARPKHEPSRAFLLGPVGRRGNGSCHPQRPGCRA